MDVWSTLIYGLPSTKSYWKTVYRTVSLPSGLDKFKWCIQMTYFRASTTAQLPTLMLQTCASGHDEAAYYTLSKMDATIKYIESSVFSGTSSRKHSKMFAIRDLPTTSELKSLLPVERANIENPFQIHMRVELIENKTSLGGLVASMFNQQATYTQRGKSKHFTLHT